MVNDFDFLCWSIIPSFFVVICRAQIYGKQFCHYPEYARMCTIKFPKRRRAQLKDSTRHVEIWGNFQFNAGLVLVPEIGAGVRSIVFWGSVSDGNFPIAGTNQGCTIDRNDSDGWRNIVLLFHILSWFISTCTNEIQKDIYDRIHGKFMLRRRHFFFLWTLIATNYSWIFH